MPQLKVAHTSGKKKENNKKRHLGERKEIRPVQEKSVLVVGAWNVRTLLDRAGNDRPERRTALIGKELSRYSIDIAALSETRFADEGQLTEAGCGYTFFWIGRPADEPRTAGVGFAIRNSMLPKLENLPKGINERLMTLRIED